VDGITFEGARGEFFGLPGFCRLFTFRGLR
jgi:hypothetical protein